MHYSAIFVSDEETCAKRDSRKLVEEVEEEHLLEGNVHNFCLTIYLFYKILIFELIFGKPLHSLIEPLGDHKQVDELLESFNRLCVIFGNGSPSLFRRIIEFHFVNLRNMSINWSNMRHHDEDNCS